MTPTTRRSFLKTSLAGAVTAPAFLSSASPNRKVAIACVGVGGKGWGDMMELAPGNEIVAVCDIDDERLARATTQFPAAKGYT
ncbi:MAG: twin-arginine translocation signal domain-containing protein, partial [Verrucomicrobiales bacterium]